MLTRRVANQIGKLVYRGQRKQTPGALAGSKLNANLYCEAEQTLKTDHSWIAQGSARDSQERELTGLGYDHQAGSATSVSHLYKTE